VRPQIALGSSASFACGALVLISEVTKHQPARMYQSSLLCVNILTVALRLLTLIDSFIAVRTMLSERESTEDDDLEVFTDAPDDTISKTDLDGVAVWYFIRVH